MIAWAVRQLVLWVVIGFVAYAAVVKLLPLTAPAPPPPQAASAQPDTGSQIVNSLTFRADRTGHVYIDGETNGSPVRFLVDTGSTLVALTVNDADAAGISRSDLNFSGRS